MQCQDDMQKFIQDNQQMVQKRTNAGSAASSPDNMLFFLHVPRTAGRTFFSCFLKQATPPSKR